MLNIQYWLLVIPINKISYISLASALQNNSSFLSFPKSDSKIIPHKQMLSHGVCYTFTSGIKLSFSLHSTEEVQLRLPKLLLKPCLSLNITVSDRMKANVSLSCKPSLDGTKTQDNVLNKQRAGSS